MHVTVVAGERNLSACLSLRMFTHLALEYRTAKRSFYIAKDAVAEGGLSPCCMRDLIRRFRDNFL
jgi:hypothetical protein